MTVIVAVAGTSPNAVPLALMVVGASVAVPRLTARTNTWRALVRLASGEATARPAKTRKQKTKSASAGREVFCVFILALSKRQFGKGQVPVCIRNGCGMRRSIIYTTKPFQSIYHLVFPRVMPQSST